MTGGHSTAVVRIIDDIVELVAFTSVSPEADAALQASFPRPVTAYPLFELVRGGQVVEIPDSEFELGVQTGARDIGRARGFRSLLLTPLRNEQGLIGLISVTRKEPGTFADHHVQLLQTFADQAVIAIENVRLFDQVKLRTDELSRSLKDLQTAQSRLIQTEKLASLGQLTAGIAHEIKNPLNFVNNFASVSAELVGELRELLDGAGIDDGMQASVDELSELLQGNLEKVVEHGKRADSIVKNMLLHSRGGSGEHMRVNINTVVSESLHLAYHGARAEKAGFNITLEESLDPSAGELDVYPQEITRVLLNLISNGFYATMARKAELNGAAYEPTISASTQNLGDSVEIRIRDNGTGIPPAVKERMFDPFFTTKPAGEGTGLGLSLSHDVVVKQHAGAIEVETQPGAFTEFRIVLPRTAASIGAGALRVSATILVVDDEADVEALFRQQFRREIRDGRFKMVFARSGDEALQLIEAFAGTTLVLILSDINMPGMSGLNLLPKVKAARPNVPVIMITAYGDTETRRTVLEAGAEALFTKPIDFPALRNDIEARVRNVGLIISNEDIWR